MKCVRLAGMILCAIVMPLLVGATPPPEVDYSADSTMETEEGVTLTSREYHTRDKDRIEMGGAEGAITIIRRDKKVVWQLMGDMYMEMPIDEANSSDLGSFEVVEQTVVGQETVNGIKTTKSKVIAVKPEGSKFGGLFWTTPDGITVKMDLLSKEGKKKTRFTKELTNLKIERQDPALFEVPAGYTKNDMGALMGKGGMPDLGELMKQSGQEQEPEKRPSRGQSRNKSADSEDSLDMGKMLKGLFGR